MKVIISNIQRFSLHDGPGIRTTVFFKGYNLKCPWCSNPENINFNIQKYMENGEKKYFGYEISLKELEKEILKDKNFFETGGGVTFSGGECLLQFENIEPLLKKLKKNNINICVETALNVPSNLVDIALKYVNNFYIDIKILGKNSINLIGLNSSLYEKNLKKVFLKNKNVIFRIPLVKKYTYTVENKKSIISFLSKYKPSKVEIFSVHNLGEKKYKLLNIKPLKFDNLDEKELVSFKNEISALDIDCEIIRL